MGKFLFQLRVALYTVVLLSVSFLALVIALVCTLVGQRLNTNYFVARTFYHVAGPIMGWKFEVEGEEYLWKIEGEGEAGKKGRSAVMVGNHQSFVDILYLGRIFPKHAAIMAKKSIKWIPGLGWWMMMSGTVFINRSNNKSAIASMTQAGEDMKRKRISLWIFPEGTRHLAAEPDLLPFKKGAFYLAVQSGTPVVPVVCENYHRLFDGKTHFRRGTLKIKVLPPIPTTGLTSADVPDLMDRTREAMVKALREISAMPSSPASISEANSPAPLLTHADRTGNYFSTSDEAAVENAVGEEEAEGGADIAPVKDSENEEIKKKDSKMGVEGAGSKKGSKKGKKLAIAMVSDFFLPVVGGVEGHIYSLGVELMKRGHKVIVITHSHPHRVGVRYLSPGLKIYYLPYLPIASSATLPNFLLFLPYFRHIMISEQIELVHGHGSLSSLAHEAILHSPLLGVRSVFTDHSLFGFGDAVGVLTNKLLVAALRCVDGVICVSNTGRENTVLRAQLDPELVSVIPNALEPDKFSPDPPRADPEHITIVVISRLVYRKGIDLLVASAPHICALFPEVRFVVGGEGPKMVELEQMREKYQLQDRVELLGRVKPADVRDVLTRGQIYLNNSLTEAFGISIIEAACAGLFVVATKVGGVSEILPRDMIEFARADEEDVIRALTLAINTIKANRHDPLRAHQRVRGMYSWASVAERTERVYTRAMETEERSTFDRLSRYLSLGSIFGPILCCIIAIQHYFFYLLEWWDPRDWIGVVHRGDDDRDGGDWDLERFKEVVKHEKETVISIDEVPSTHE
ncbi:phosphatidylinositol glycan, class A [Kwoniella heveanensis CBS 569]|nr:phosphatidylinositol glycan, class A [Kwoniella heveanensis CBS 569]